MSKRKNKLTAFLLNASMSESEQDIKDEFGVLGHYFYIHLLRKITESDYHTLDLREVQKQERLSRRGGIDIDLCLNILNRLAVWGFINPILWQLKIVFYERFVENVLVYGYQTRHDQRPYTLAEVINHLYLTAKERKIINDMFDETSVFINPKFTDDRSSNINSNSIVDEHLPQVLVGSGNLPALTSAYQHLPEVSKVILNSREGNIEKNKLPSQHLPLKELNNKNIINNNNKRIHKEITEDKKTSTDNINEVGYEEKSFIEAVEKIEKIITGKTDDHENRRLEDTNELLLFFNFFKFRRFDSYSEAKIAERKLKEFKGILDARKAPAELISAIANLYADQTPNLNSRSGFVGKTIYGLSNGYWDLKNILVDVVKYQKEIVKKREEKMKIEKKEIEKNSILEIYQKAQADYEALPELDQANIRIQAIENIEKDSNCVLAELNLRTEPGKSILRSYIQEIMIKKTGATK